jgi:hypothetical protein
MRAANADGVLPIDFLDVSQKSAAVACAEMAKKAIALNEIRPSAIGAFISQSVAAAFVAEDHTPPHAPCSTSTALQAEPFCPY